MNARIIPFPAPKPAPVRQISIDGEYFEDEIPELFDADEDFDELTIYAHIANTWANTWADTWADTWND